MIDKTYVEILYIDRKYTVEEVARELKVSFWTLYDFMGKYDIQRRDRSEAGYNFHRNKPQFEIKTSLSIAEEKLKLAGIMLYWAEGTLMGNTVDFANSNPNMIKIFLKFLRDVCGVKEKRLRVYLYAYSYQNIDSLKSYWHKITNIPLGQFTKPFIRKGNPNLSKRKLVNGLVHIRYNDKKLLGIIGNWIKDNSLLWTGTQVAKGGRLFKAALSSNARCKSR